MVKSFAVCNFIFGKHDVTLQHCRNSESNLVNERYTGGRLKERQAVKGVDAFHLLREGR